MYTSIFEQEGTSVVGSKPTLATPLPHSIDSGMGMFTMDDMSFGEWWVGMFFFS